MKDLTKFESTVVSGVDVVIAYAYNIVRQGEKSAHQDSLSSPRSFSRPAESKTTERTALKRRLSLGLRKCFDKSLVGLGMCLALLASSSGRSDISSSRRGSTSCRSSPNSGNSNVNSRRWEVRSQCGSNNRRRKGNFGIP
jgi:hypothetical protein